VFVPKDFPILGFDDRVLPNPLDHSHASPIYSLPSLTPKYYINVPISTPMICDATMNLGYEDNLFNIFGRSVIIMCPLVTLEAMISPLTLIVYA